MGDWAFLSRLMEYPGAMVWAPIVEMAVGGRVTSLVKVKSENILAAHLQNLWGRTRHTEAEKIAQVAHFEAPAGIEGYGTCLTFLSACNDTGILLTVPILGAWRRELANSKSIKTPLYLSSKAFWYIINW